MTIAPKLLRVLSGETVTAPPIWLMRQAGRYLPEYKATRAEAGSFLDLCYNPALACEVTLQPIRRFGFDAAILFADILLVPHGLGQELWFETGEGPRLTPITTADGLAALKGDEAFHDHLSPVYETVRRLKAALLSDVPLIGFAGAPWTVMTYMIAGRGKDEQAGARALMCDEPSVFDAMLDRVTEATALYLIRQADAGADVLKVFDSWAAALADDEPAFRRCCLEPAMEIVERVRRVHPDIPFILFPRGAGPHYPLFAEAPGINGVAIDTDYSLAEARDRLQPHAAVQGNLDPAHMVTGGEALDRAARDVLDHLGGGPMIFNLGHGITPDADPANVTRLIEVVRSYG
jgi:uroporphyrinogen decarboxylase